MTGAQNPPRQVKAGPVGTRTKKIQKRKRQMNKTQSRNQQHAARQIKDSAAAKRAKQGPRCVSMSAVGGQVLEIGSIATGRVKKVLDCGVIIALDDVDGMVHVSEISERWVQNPLEYFKIGDTVRSVVIGVDIGKNRVSLSIKRIAHEDKRGQQVWEKEYLTWYKGTLIK
jgi:transcriptional accessory protein Tex/SPT6